MCVCVRVFGRLYVCACVYVCLCVRVCAYVRASLYVCALMPHRRCGGARDAVLE